MSKHDERRPRAVAGGIETRAIHSGQQPDPAFGAVAAPIYQTSTFAFDSLEQGARRFRGEDDGFIYSRLANPTTRRLEICVADLERGYDALAVASGLAAVSTALLGLLEAGDHVVLTDRLYGPTRLLVEGGMARFGVRTTCVDTADLDAVRAAMTGETRLLLIETPSNPTLRLTDIAACAALCRERKILLAVDNTFCSPVLQRPLELGADLVLHSTTKFINGHADVIGGIIVARSEKIWRRVRRARTLFGASMDPHQSWLVLRGIRTLPLRIRAAQSNAGRLARLLQQDPRVERVNYPGLDSHPQAALARRQMDGAGAMISFVLRGGFDAGRRFVSAPRLATLAVSLGGVESLVEHPASMSHVGLGEAERERMGLPSGLVRLAVGCESAGDLEQDLRDALDAIG